METEYLADEREFGETTLANGLKCVFVRDPRMYNVSVQLEIGGGSESDPAGLSGLATICASVVLRGSARFPGIGSLLEFISDNNILYSFKIKDATTRIAAELPTKAFDEYLDRLSDMISNPEFSQEALECSKLKYGMMFYPLLTTVEYRVTHAIYYMHGGIIDQGSSLFGKKIFFLAAAILRPLLSSLKYGGLHNG